MEEASQAPAIALPRRLSGRVMRGELVVTRMHEERMARKLLQRGLSQRGLPEQPGDFADGATASSQRVAQPEDPAEGAIATLRREITHAMHDERKARLMETAELRSMLEELQRKPYLRKTSDVLGERQFIEGTTNQANVCGSTGEHIAEARCEELARELEAECENRCAKNAELHARIGREFCTWIKQLEEQRDELEMKIALIQKSQEKQFAALEQAMERDREQRGTEYDEFRETLGVMWQRILLRPPEPPEKQRLFMDEAGDQREFVGDGDDVLTLYDLVRDAVSDSTRLSNELSSERDQRNKDIEKVKRGTKRLEHRLNKFETVVHSMSSRSQPMSADSPKHARTLAQLAAAEPQWNLLLNDPDHLFNPDDVIDEAYEKYLGDIIPLMIEHECTFKRGIELSAANILAENTSDCELSPVRSKPGNSSAAASGMSDLAPTSVHAETP